VVERSLNGALENISSFVHAETVTLLGVALKFLGASWTAAEVFFFRGTRLDVAVDSTAGVASA
jgi:hypothetical protein